MFCTGGFKRERILSDEGSTSVWLVSENIVKESEISDMSFSSRELVRFLYLTLVCMSDGAEKKETGF